MQALENVFSSFRQGVRSLHEKISTLPVSRQQALRDLVDRADGECSRLHETCQELRDSVDDLHLATKYAEFEITATAREIHEARRSHRLAP